MTNFALKSIYAWYRNLVANPKYRWWVIGGTLIYLLSPIDIAPDFLPLIGQIDDAVVITLLATELIQVLKDRNAAMKKNKTESTATAEPVTVEAVVVE